MAIHFFKTVRNSIKHWYIHLLIGLLFIAVGLWVFQTPGEAYVSLAFIFSLSFLISGIMEAYFAIANRDITDNWGWTLAQGILNIIVGVLLLNNPEISVVALTYYVGFVIMFRSISAISSSIDLRNYGVSDWGYLMALGIVGVIFSFILLWNPLFAGMTLVVCTGLAFIAMGGFSIYLSFKLKSLHDLPKKISTDLKDRLKAVQKEIQEELASN